MEGECDLKVKNGTAFCPDKIFEPNPESERKVNAKPQSGSDKRNIDKKQPYVIGAHSQLVRKTRRHMKTVFLEKIFEPDDERHIFHFECLQI